MDASFWHERWQAGQIGFHEAGGNARLPEFLPALGLEPGARVLVPLCGKSRDMTYLLAQGLRVVGVELSRLAVSQFFDETGLVPEVAQAGPLERFAAPGIEIFAGDFFEMTPGRLGAVDAVYDRAALIALPAEMRARYAEHVRSLAGGTPQLVICLSYDQSLRDGPPFSVDADELARLYGGHYRIERLSEGSARGSIGGVKDVRESVWHLRPLE